MEDNWIICKEEKVDVWGIFFKSIYHILKKIIYHSHTYCWRDIVGFHICTNHIFNRVECSLPHDIGVDVTHVSKQLQQKLWMTLILWDEWGNFRVNGLPHVLKQGIAVVTSVSRSRQKQIKYAYVFSPFRKDLKNKKLFIYEIKTKSYAMSDNRRQNSLVGDGLTMLSTPSIAFLRKWCHIRMGHWVRYIYGSSHSLHTSNFTFYFSFKFH